MAELVDAADSKSAIRKGVKVRFLSWALSIQSIIIASLSGFYNLQTICNHVLFRATKLISVEIFRMEKNFNNMRVLNIPKFFGKRN